MLRGVDVKPKILVVDDNAAAAGMLATLLRHHGFATETAHSSAQAVSLAESFLPHVVFLDLCLGDDNGLATVSQLRQLQWGKTMRIIALTSSAGEATRRSVLAAGMEQHLTKPARIDEIIQAIEGPAAGKQAVHACGVRERGD